MDQDKCYYCDKEAKYNQLVLDVDEYTVTGVCKTHLINDFIA
jgi:hypothetical protein